MGIPSSLSGILTGARQVSALRIWNRILNADTLALVTESPNPGSAPASTPLRVFITSDGTQYAWDITGRYVWWSTDNGDTWTAHDYGTAICTTDLYGRVVIKDGVETMMLGMFGGSTYAWATLAFPPVRTAFTAPFTNANVGDAFDGEPLLVGQAGASQGRISRWVSGAWQTVTLSSGAGQGTANSACKTRNGTYLAGMWDYTPKTNWVKRSTDFTTWSAAIDVLTDPGYSSVAAGFVYGPAGSNVVVRPIANTYNPDTIRYSLDDGATWALATYPAMGANSVRGRGAYANSRYYVIATFGVYYSFDGITWAFVGHPVTFLSELADAPLMPLP